MKTKVQLFDPALCCPTGVCGPNVDPELTRISRTVMKLVKEGYDVSRYNLAQEAEHFTANEDITTLLENDGPEALPATVVNGKLVLNGRYPTVAEFAEWLNIDETDIQVNLPKKTLPITPMK
ncbi:arsenite efflux transporter metallochaperone ArsD [Salipaludibacillus agaradhaerens]|jgi:hypothetical protein|uniref:arsenite efflux transporter metallochaperone ArsD n=1 Tax=Salipaludibacillus agaradhaerens TaxID=76935 RepID=UPI0021513193|nr:arsenite efflux transporter metallochaperone ArsD [Salipaludibacillus agaradhaerens]MCR6105836.1 arsenite efflux transporter metallochaperone ArsD [Salipaludibacillus agaradhaerens]MCR6117871.1 arsenite efflux transporter metallochaperone ArsD [Salipaludibacillus agaradhaerens]UJW57020.1 arsenite efflux transporter metallochaperone ArsD [Bacillus sp. A116_S68]